MNATIASLLLSLSAAAPLPAPAAPSAAIVLAQARACPPPLKYAAGSCVAQCPAGFEDRGRTCELRTNRSQGWSRLRPPELAVRA